MEYGLNGVSMDWPYGCKVQAALKASLRCCFLCVFNNDIQIKQLAIDSFFRLNLDFKPEF